MVFKYLIDMSEDDPERTILYHFEISFDSISAESCMLFHVVPLPTVKLPGYLFHLQKVCARIPLMLNKTCHVFHPLMPDFFDCQKAVEPRKQKRFAVSRA